MTIDDLQTLIDLGNVPQMQNIFGIHSIINNVICAVSQLEPRLHAINDTTKRPDKIVNDDKGAFQKTIPVARISIPFQKKITLLAAAFLGTPTIEAAPETPVQENFLSVIKKAWIDNKLDYKFKNLAKKVMSEKHAAELWYIKNADGGYWDGYEINTKFKLGMKIICNTLGDSLYPVFDQYGSMIAFGRHYQIRDEKGKFESYFDLYTDDNIYYTKEEEGQWLWGDGALYSPGVKSIKNPIGKIPIIYYWQPLTEWDDVQALIERLETKLSNLADTNDYFDSPVLVAAGKIISLGEKGQTGKVLEMENNATVSYLTWDQLPESTKLEIDGLVKFIYSFTHTPDVSLENLKGLGYFSTVALKTMFIDAHLKASDKEELFGEGLQRRLNYMKVALSVFDSTFKPALTMEVKPKFHYFLPENILETVQILTQAVTSNIMSHETAIQQNPLVSDAAGESEKIKAEVKSRDYAVTAPGGFVGAPPAEKSGNN